MRNNEWHLTIERYLAEGRTVSGGKHDDVKKAASTQQALENKRTDAAIKQQTDLLNKLQSGFSQYLTKGGQGYDPLQLALTKSQFLNSDTSQFNNARQGVMSSLAGRGAGGNNLPVGGDYVRGLSGLYGQEASNRSSGLANIDLSNLQQSLTNRFNAGSILSGNAATLNSPIASGTSGAGNALDNFTKAGLTPGFGSMLLGSLAGGLGQGLGAGLTGGIGGILGGFGKSNTGPGSQSGLLDYNK